MKSRKILVTSALPYANGSIHIGHVLGTVLHDDCWAIMGQFLDNVFGGFSR